ncbi:hypothetical protein NEFER03_2156 [Nematocida sp. LUAm3]|nr:hypothetical protein NEFER03_2156 [Nematocida sp. LUAm3]KAI5174627.1 hypothetical protein NEFER02_0748 [Nematocida sp. LUAm2]KAI5177967.1 hypothetical protein NEFER01_1149 [Nematocida sp. LUAm1]
MREYIVLTNQGPILVREEKEQDVSIVFAGCTYKLPMDQVKMEKVEEPIKGKEDIYALCYSAVDLVQKQKYGKVSHKKKMCKLISLKQRGVSGSLSYKVKRNTISEILISGLSHIFQTTLFGAKKKKEKNIEYIEGVCSIELDRPRRPKSIEPFIIFETENTYEIVDGSYKVVLNESIEETEDEKKEDKVVLQTEEETSQRKKLLVFFEKGFFLGEYAFILGLIRSKECIKSMGRCMYNDKYLQIFRNLLNVIEMYIAVFLNTVGRSIDRAYIAEDIDEYIKKQDNIDYSSYIYKKPEKELILDRIAADMVNLEKEKKTKSALESISLTFVEYFDEVKKVIYSNEFISYIGKVEESITLYKSICNPEISAEERKYNTNICFLFVDIYHRIIKYKMYLEEASCILKKSVSEQLSFSGSLLLLSSNILQITELLQATERFKKIRGLEEEGIRMPDCIDDFVEMFSLTNGSVILTKQNMILINGGHVSAVVSKKEVIGVFSLSEEDPIEYIDLAITSLYPPAQSYVVDYINDKRVHWIRLNFKWYGYAEKFISAWNCRSVSTIPGLEMVLTKDSVFLPKRLRERITEEEAKISHKRTLLILSQRHIIRTSDLYTYGPKRKLTTSDLFAIKDFIDQLLGRYKESIQSPEEKNRNSVPSIKQIYTDALKVITTHSPVTKSTIYDEEHNEFSCLYEESPSSLQMITVIIEYLSYVFRILPASELFIYSSSAMQGLTSVSEMKNLELSNADFLDLAIGCSSMAVPPSLSRNEFLLSLIAVRFMVIAAPDLTIPIYLSICSPLFIFHSKQLMALP